MSAIDEIQANPSRYMTNLPRTARGVAIDPQTVINGLQTVAPLFWAWYRSQNPDRVIFKLYVFSVTIRKLLPVFTTLFGPEQ